MIGLPAGSELTRTTREFDELTVPAGLEAAHRIAAGVWGCLVVLEGSLRFGFEDTSEEHDLIAPARQVIPPARLHHVAVDGPVRFKIEFYRADAEDTVTE